jgi:secreted PhoX family phosphatase
MVKSRTFSNVVSGFRFFSEHLELQMTSSYRKLILATTAMICLGTVAHADAVSDSRLAAMAQTSIYRVGYPVEVSIESGKGLGSDPFAANTVAAKHYGMGRLSYELAFVMPDSRTVYTGADETNGGMFRFVADTAGDLSSGELFAAKLTQAAEKGAKSSSFKIEWMSFGHASDADIDAIIAKGVKFSDLFDAADVAADACPAGFTPIDTVYGPECLTLKTANAMGMSADEIKLAASRLETARFAAVMGATSEFRKMEGVTFDPKRNKLYMAISDLAKGMADASKLAGTADDINLKGNKCGAVMQLSVGADMATTDMEVLVSGGPANGSAVVNACAINNIASPDNVTMGFNEDTLLIAEDTDHHQNDVLWAYDLDAGSLTRLMSTPYGSEVTSPFYYKTIDDKYDYLVTVVQHPYGESDEGMAMSPDDTRAYVGYVAIPAKVQPGDKVGFKPLPFAATDADKRMIKFTDTMTLNGAEVALNGYQTLLRSGDKVGDAVFGQAVAKDGTPLVDYVDGDLPGGVSTSQDHTSLHRTEAGEMFSITQFEEEVGTMYIASLDHDAVTGTLVVTGLKPVDLSAAFGGFDFCAGMTTPWGSHLGGEEWDMDARAFEAAGMVDKDFDKYLTYFGFNTAAM